jgi:putative ABC transport system permease protein
MLREVRLALRLVTRQPVLCLVAWSVVAIGIAIPAASSSLIRSLLFPSLPVRDSDQLLFVYAEDASHPQVHDAISFEHYHVLQHGLRDRMALTIRSAESVKAWIATQPLTISSEIVDPNYFEVLQVHPAIGRPLPAEEAAGDLARGALISATLWKRYFDGAPDVIGQQLAVAPSTRARGFYVDRLRSYTIVGVMPESFTGTLGPWRRTDLWLPLAARMADHAEEEPDYLHRRWFGGPIGRIAATARRENVQATVRDIGRSVQPILYPDSPTWGFVAVRFPKVRLPGDDARDIVPSQLAASTLAMSGLVTGVALASLIGIILTRVMEQRTALATRQMLGAPLGAIVASLAAEALVLVAGGAALGFLLAHVLVRFVATRLLAGAAVNDVAPVELYQLGPLIGSVVAVGAAALVIVVAIGIRTFRALDPKIALGQVVVDESHRSRRLISYGVVLPQVTLALTMLVPACSNVKQVLAAERARTGYDLTNVAVCDYELPIRTTSDRDDVRDLMSRRPEMNLSLVEALRRSPSIRNAALADGLPVAPSSSWAVAEDRFDRPAQWVNRLGVSDGYFETLRIRLLAGRYFTRGDEGQRVMIVDRSLSDRLWPGDTAMGKRIALAQDLRRDADMRSYEVVGIVEASRPLLADGAQPTVYVPTSKADAHVLLYHAGSLLDARQAIEEWAGATGGRISVRLRPLRSIAEQMLSARRSVSVAFAFAGAMALVVACAGLYGISLYAVERRRREFGLRRALGARPLDLLRVVVGEYLLPCAAGALFGCVLLSVMKSSLSANAGLTLVVAWEAVILVPFFMAVAFVAACVPAVRAALRHDPLENLRA